MKNSNFTPRRKKLIELKDNIDVLLLGQSNKEYIQLINRYRNETVRQIRIEELEAALSKLENKKVQHVDS